MNKPNFQWHSLPETIQETSSTMIIFGAEHFKSALVIQKIEALKQLIKDRKEGNVPDQVFHNYMWQFFFEKLTAHLLLDLTSWLSTDQTNKQYL